MGQTLIYTLTVSNAGPSASENVILEESTPDGLSNMEFSLDNGATWNTWSGLFFRLGTLSNGDVITILIRGTVTSTPTQGYISNRAIVHSDTTDPDLTNNDTTITTTIADNPPASADLSITKVR